MAVQGCVPVPASHGSFKAHVPTFDSHSGRLKGTVPLFDPADKLRRTIDWYCSASSTWGQMRLSEIREHWEWSEEELRYALVQLVEEGELKVFPIGNVVKVAQA